MTTHFWRYGAVALLGYAFLSPSEASAGVVLVTWGDTISHIGDVPPQNRQNPGASKGQNLVANRVGFKYGYWGMFWIDMWTHGGTYCVYEGDRYHPITEAEAARLLGKSVDELSTPFLYKVPLGWMIFGPLILLAAILGIINTAIQDSRRNELERLFNDTRYQKALEKLNESLAKQPAATPAAEGAGPESSSDETRFSPALEAGVQHLIESGIPREEAVRNLTMMVQVLIRAQQQNAAPVVGIG
ncbi:MAG: hypothetical protein U0793_29180 [Gemmataceae bacterium]